MPMYKNITQTSKIFYGVEIGPNEVKDIPGLVMSPGIIQFENVVSINTKQKKINPVINKRTTAKNSDNKRQRPQRNKNKVIESKKTFNYKEIKEDKKELDIVEEHKETKEQEIK